MPYLQVHTSFTDIYEYMRVESHVQITRADVGVIVRLDDTVFAVNCRN